MEFLSLTELIACCGIIFVSAVLQIATGMGFGMIASPMIALIKPELAPGCVLATGLFVAFSGAWRERANIARVELKLGVGGRIVGSLAALIILLSVPSVEVFMILFGSIMLAAIIITALGVQIQFNNGNLFALSVVSGVMGSITAVGAPPMAIIYHNRDPAVVRPTLNAFFGAGAILGLISLGLSGWLTFQAIIAAILLIPAMIAGIAFARRFQYISHNLLSALLLFLSGAASLLLIARGLTAIL